MIPTELQEAIIIHQSHRRDNMDISPELKERAKAHRLQQLQIRYFELEMDKVALEVAGDNARAAEVATRMEAIQAAYKAVEAIAAQ